MMKYLFGPLNLNRESREDYLARIQHHVSVNLEYPQWLEGDMTNTIRMITRDLKTAGASWKDIGVSTRELKMLLRGGYLAEARGALKRMQELSGYFLRPPTRDSVCYPVDLSDSVETIKKMCAKLRIGLEQLPTSKGQLETMFKNCFKRRLKSERGISLYSLSGEKRLEKEADKAWKEIIPT